MNLMYEQVTTCWYTSHSLCYNIAMLENIASVNLTGLIQAKTTPAQLRVIQEVAKVVNEGLPLNDALKLSRITKQTWDKWVEDIPEIDQFIDVQRLEYKRQLLRVLRNQATSNGDVKIAMALLMSAFPQEFNPAIQKEQEKRKPVETEENSMLSIFQEIQKMSSGPINATQDNRQTTPTTSDRITTSLKDILAWRNFSQFQSLQAKMRQSIFRSPNQPLQST